MSSADARWKALSGLNNWEGLLDPLASDLRPYLIHYGSMVEAVGNAFINDPASKNIGLSRYARSNLLAKTGIAKADPLSKYEVTKYFYAPSTIPTPTDQYSVKPTRDDAVLKESNWMGYVAVATDEGKSVLGRRDILIAWRGTIRMSEWNENFKFNLVNAPVIFEGNSVAMVHSGWYDMYTSINQDSVFNNQSARDQIREEVESLIEKYKGEEISISVTGHSLGGSLATITAVDLAANPFHKDILVTAFLFASPKVGDVNFKNAFAALGNLRALRIFNYLDIVPAVPPFGLKPDNKLELYQEVGVGFAINASESEYIKKDVNSFFTWHDLMVYLHGIDGFLGSQGGFEPHGDFGITQLNKYSENLKADNTYFAPVAWWVVENKGMVQLDDGTWILDDREVDETF